MFEHKYFWSFGASFLKLKCNYRLQQLCFKKGYWVPNMLRILWFF